MSKLARVAAILYWLGLLGAILCMTILGVGCAYSSPLDPDAPQIEFVWSGVYTQAHIDKAQPAWDAVAECMNFKDHVGTLKIEVMRGGFLCGTVWAAGCTYPGRIQLSHDTFPIRHEFIHVIDGRRGYMPDYEHKGLYWGKCDR